MTHPIGAALVAAAEGRFPPVDGRWELVAPWRPGLEAVVAFTGHAFVVITADREVPAAVRQRADGFGGAHDPRVALALAGTDGWIDSLDAVLVRHGVGGTPGLVERPDLTEHHRVRFAAAVRDDVRSVGRPTGDDLVTIGRGIGGLVELGVEADSGRGAELLGQALTLVPASEVVAACVAPGNARALRAFLAAGFRPVASVQLLRRRV